jgi:hypothetical protein
VVAARPAAPLTVIESTGDAASVRRPKFDLAARAATRLGLNLRCHLGDLPEARRRLGGMTLEPARFFGRRAVRLPSVAVRHISQCVRT